MVNFQKKKLMVNSKITDLHHLFFDHKEFMVTVETLLDILRINTKYPAVELLVLFLKVKGAPSIQRHIPVQGLLPPSPLWAPIQKSFPLAISDTLLFSAGD